MLGSAACSAALAENLGWLCPGGLSYVIDKEWCLLNSPSKRGFASFTGADTNDLFHFGDKDFAIAYFAGLRRFN